MKKLLLVLAWFLITPAFLGASITTAYNLRTSSVELSQTPHNSSFPNQLAITDGPILSQVKGISTDVLTGDARPIIIAQFLETNDSPLKPYNYFGQYLTSLADRYNLDFRLLPSIMMQESNLCKKIPDNSYNCLGLGIHSQGTWTFKRYEDNFEAAAKVLREKYIDQGYITPDEIQDKYTPSSNGSWEFAVNHFMEVLETAEF